MKTNGWKLRLLALVAVFALLGCTAARRSNHTSRHTHTEQVSRDAESTSTLRYVDTTRTESQRVTITEVEFYPPSAVSAGDTVTAIIALNDIGRIENAPIRTFRQTVIETVIEEKGQSLESEEMEGEVIRSEVAIHSKETSEETGHPPLGYNRCLYAAMAIMMLFIYLGRKRIWGWFITFIARLRKIL